jgi:hypothetical protein
VIPSAVRSLACFGLATVVLAASSCFPRQKTESQIHEERIQDVVDSVLVAAPRAPMAGRNPDDRLLRVGSGRGKEGLVDTLGRVVAEPEFDETRSSSEGRSAVRKNLLWGLVDGTGLVVIEPTWDELSGFSEGLAVVATGIKRIMRGRLPVQEGGRRGYIDRDGRVVIPARFEEASRFAGGVAWVREGGKWGLIDRNGEFLIRPRYESMTGPLDFSEGVCPIHLAGDWVSDENPARFGYIDATGATVIPPMFERADRFSEGIASIVKGGKVGFIDRAGKAVIEPRFDRVPGEQRLPSFSEGLAAVGVGGRYGFIDTTGRFVIEPRFVHAEGFHEGLAAVRQDGKVGFIDREGRMVVAPRFTRAHDFDHGVARVGVTLEHPRVPPDRLAWGYIRADGGFIWNPLGPYFVARTHDRRPLIAR